MISKDRQWVANQGWAGVLVLLIFVARVGGGGGAVQNRESPDFRSQEVGSYAFQCFIW